MKHNRRRSPGKPRISPTVRDRINPNVAGIDCGAAEHFVAVPPDRDATPVQSVQTFTSERVHLAEWLTACRVQSVAMEATGVYWIPIYEILAASRYCSSTRAISRTCPGAKATSWIASGSASSTASVCCAEVSDRPRPSSPSGRISAIARR